MQERTIIFDTQRYTAQLPESVPSHQVATALAKKLGLPQQEADGTLYVYYLGVDERPLDPQQSLSELNFTAEAPLFLWRNTMRPPVDNTPSYDHLLVRPARATPSVPTPRVRTIWPILSGILVAFTIIACLFVPSLLFLQIREVESQRIEEQSIQTEIETEPPERWSVEDRQQTLSSDEYGVVQLPWPVADALYSPYLEQVIFLVSYPRALHFYELETGAISHYSLQQDGVVSAVPDSLDISPDGERLLITHDGGGRTLLHLDSLIAQPFPAHDPDDPLCIVTDGSQYCFIPPAQPAESCPLLWSNQGIGGVDSCGKQRVLTDDSEVVPLPDAFIAEATVRAVFYVPKANRFVMLYDDSSMTRLYDFSNVRKTFFPVLKVGEEKVRGNGRYLFLHPDENEITIVAQATLENGNVIDYLFRQPMP